MDLKNEIELAASNNVKEISIVKNNDLYEDLKQVVVRKIIGIKYWLVKYKFSNKWIDKFDNLCIISQLKAIVHLIFTMKIDWMKMNSRK